MTNPLLKEQGLPLFSQIQPEHVEAALDATLLRNRDELAKILERTAAPDFLDTIVPLEEMEDRLHRVWSPVSHLQMVASTDEMRDVYNACLPKLSHYSTELAQNADLFKLYQAVDSTFEKADTRPEKRLLEHALRDFRLAGVDLPALIELILRVSQMLGDNPEIRELDINPVFAFEDGLKAVDACVFL